MSAKKGRKLYVHLEDRETYVLQDVQDELTIGAVWELVVQSFDPNGDQKLESRGLQAFSAKGRLLDSTQSLRRAIGKDLDLYLSLRDTDKHVVKERTSIRQKSAAIASNAIDDDQEGSAQGLASQPKAEQTANGREHRCKVQSPLVAPLLQKAAEKEASLHYKAAAFIYKQVSGTPFGFLHASIYIPYIMWRCSVGI